MNGITKTSMASKNIPAGPENLVPRPSTTGTPGSIPESGPHEPVLKQPLSAATVKNRAGKHAKPSAHLDVQVNQVSDYINLLQGMDKYLSKHCIWVHIFLQLSGDLSGLALIGQE